MCIVFHLLLSFSFETCIISYLVFVFILDLSIVQRESMHSVSVFVGFCTIYSYSIHWNGFFSSSQYSHKYWCVCVCDLCRLNASHCESSRMNDINKPTTRRKKNKKSREKNVNDFVFSLARLLDEIKFIFMVSAWGMGCASV